MRTYQYYHAYPDGKRKAFTVSYDDGNDCDEKLVEMLRRHHAKGTFNINSAMFGDLDDAPEPRRWRRMTAEECVQLYGDDMEVAVHGAVHPYWDCMHSESLLQDIYEDKRELERLFGRIIRGAAAPYGRMSDDVADVLRLAGFTYCRASGQTKTIRLRKFDPMCFKSTIHHREPEALELARKLADGSGDDGQLRLLYVVGHSYEFIERDNWHVMEELLSIVCDREDIWYCTNLELFDYLAAVKRLHWNVDQSLVENPSAQDVWMNRMRIYKDPEMITVKIPAGQTVKL